MADDRESKPSVTLDYGLGRVFRNLGHLLAGKTTAALISLAYLPLVTRALGAEGYGLLILVHGYVMLVASIVTFSGWHAIVHYGHQALQDRDYPRFMKLVRSMLAIEFGLAIMAIVVAVVLVPFVGPHLHWSPATMVLAELYSVAIVTGVRATSQGLVQLVHRVDLLGFAQLTAPLIRLAGTIGFYFTGGSVASFLMLWLVAAVAEAIGFWSLGIWSFQSLRANEPLWGSLRGVQAENRGFLRFVVSTNIDITMRDLSPALIPIVVGWLLGPAAAGVYALAQKAASVFQQPAKLLTNSVFAIFAEFTAKREWEHLRLLVWRTAAIVLSAALPVLGVIALLRHPLITWLGGPSFSIGSELLLLLALGQAAALLSPIFSAALTALSRPGLTIAINLAIQVGLLPILFFFIILAGLAGVGWYAVLAGVTAPIVTAMAFSRQVARVDADANSAISYVI